MAAGGAVRKSRSAGCQKMSTRSRAPRTTLRKPAGFEPTAGVSW